MRKSRETTTPLRATDVKKALQSGKPGLLKDTGSLYLQITAPGKGRWIFRGRLSGDGRIVEVVCGNASTPLTEARAKRDEYRLLLRKGINPNELAAQQAESEREQEEQDARTFAAVAEEYFGLRQDMKEKSLQTERGRIRLHTAAISDVPVSSIRRLDHLKPLIDTLSAQHKFEQARRVAELIGRIFQFAVNAGYIEHSPADKLVKLVPRQPRGSKKHHAAVVDPDEAAGLFRKIWELIACGRCSPHLAAAMKLSCYLPIRNGNMIEARWEHVDLVNMRWKFPTTKNGHSYEVPITTQMKQEFEHLAQYRTNGWCFPSGSRSGHISNGGMGKMLRLAGVTREEHTLHGFRSTFETISLEHGLPKVLCEYLLFHVAGNAVEQAYNRTRYQKILPYALQWWDDTVDALRLGQPVPEIPAPLKDSYR